MDRDARGAQEFDLSSYNAAILTTMFFAWQVANSIIVIYDTAVDTLILTYFFKKEVSVKNEDESKQGPRRRRKPALPKEKIVGRRGFTEFMEKYKHPAQQEGNGETMAVEGV